MAQGLPQEYLDYLKRNVNWLERLGDSLHGVDERVDWVAKQVAQLEGLSELAPQLKQAVDSLREMGIAMPTQTQQVNLSYNLDPEQGVRLTDEVPFDGSITSVMFHFPRGCDGLVRMALGYASKQLAPTEGFLALNDATPVFPMSEQVKEGDTVWAIFENADLINAHNVSVAVTIQGAT